MWWFESSFKYSSHPQRDTLLPLWLGRQKGHEQPSSTVPCPRGLRALAFWIPLNGCGSGAQMRLESPGETFGSRTGNLSPQQAPQFDPVPVCWLGFLIGYCHIRHLCYTSRHGKIHIKKIEWIQSFALRELKTSGIRLTFLSCWQNISSSCEPRKQAIALLNWLQSMGTSLKALPARLGHLT